MGMMRGVSLARAPGAAICPGARASGTIGLAMSAPGVDWQVVYVILTVIAIVAMAAIREKMNYSDVPKGLRGLGITFITAGLMSIAFMMFSGIQL